MTGPDSTYSTILTVDLAAIRENYRILKTMAGTAICAGVVKANAYGTGLSEVAPVLWEEECRVFYVAHLSEAINLREILPAEAEIHVFHGLLPGVETEFATNNLIPVINSLADIIRWNSFCKTKPLPCDIHVDTGMCRLGLPPDELEHIKNNPEIVADMDIRYVMSHPASAENLDTDQSSAQLAAFLEARKVLPQGKASFCNSAAIFLGSDYHFDIVRPGVGLYGSAPNRDHSQTLKPVISLRSQIIQIRNVSPPETVGYGATYQAKKPTKVATLPIGYADGYFRSLSSSGLGYIGDTPVPVIGRVSMDLITVDVTDVPEHLCRPGEWVELIGPHISIDQIAATAGTMSYELLTNLGNRYHRIYKT